MGRVGLIDDIIVVCLLYRYFIYLPALRMRRQAAGDSGGRGKAEAPREKVREDETSDPYKVLGVASDASAAQIKQAYRELANKYHPDKVSHLGDEFQEMAHKRFKEIQVAYQELSRQQ